MLITRRLRMDDADIAQRGNERFGNTYAGFASNHIDNSRARKDNEAVQSMTVLTAIHCKHESWEVVERHWTGVAPVSASGGRDVRHMQALSSR